MSARAEILNRIRLALGPGERDVDELPRGYRSTSVRDDLVGLFSARVEDYRATVTRVAPDDPGGIERAIATALTDGGAAGRVVVPDGLSFQVPNAVVDEGLSATELDAMAAVVTEATLGVAETGTLVLTHGPGQGRRAISLVPDIHVCVLRADRIVADVPAAIARLDPDRPQTWVSGPSATSDIELARVEGVHGPRTLRVVLTDGTEGL